VASIRLTDDQTATLAAAVLEQAVRDATVRPPKIGWTKKHSTSMGPLRLWFRDRLDAWCWFYERGGMFDTICETCNPLDPEGPRQAIFARLIP
jgi:hypothetical protein